MLKGMLIFAAGDSAAALISSSFSWTRMLGILVVGGTFYAFEIPNYFRWIDRKVTTKSPWKKAIQRTGLAMAYFNPLWIARHLAFIKLASLDFDAIGIDLVQVGALSFAFNIPLAILGNFIIQVKLPLKWRFVGSSIFSALMAVYYALSDVFLGD